MGLTIINAEKGCTGKWRGVEDGHSSILDYVLTNRDDAVYIEEMIIDGNRERTPYRVLDDTRGKI